MLTLIKNGWQVVDAFRRDADLDARRISVDTFDAKATLSGSVSSWSERDEAEAAAPAATLVDEQLTDMP